MVKTIRKVGNSGGVTLDRALLDLAHLKLGDKVVVSVRDGSIVLTPANVGFGDEELDETAARLFKKYRKTFRKLAE
ncbi:MAG: hypothetical protein IT463_08135 [Planctomycetes bacterium]|nr:hypothetical protein [Planctomycetota bacterium]